METLKYLLDSIAKEKDEIKRKFLQSLVSDLLANNHKESMAKIQAESLNALSNHNHLELEGSASASITTLESQKFRITLKGNSKVVIGKEVFQSTAETTTNQQPTSQPKTGVANRIIKTATKAEIDSDNFDL